MNTYGKANELRERVSDHMKEDDEILVEKIHQLKVDDIVRMLVSVYNSINMLTAHTLDNDHIEDTHCHLLRALNHINKVDKLLRANQRSPIWF